MGKASRTRRKEARRKAKLERKAANRARYEAVAGTAANRKKKKRSSSSAWPVTKHTHAIRVLREPRMRSLLPGTRSVTTWQHRGVYRKLISGNWGLLIARQDVAQEKPKSGDAVRVQKRDGTVVFEPIKKVLKEDQHGFHCSIDETSRAERDS